MSKVALITGVTGQDGSYLARLLLHKGYEVHGIKRRSSSFNTERIENIYDVNEVDFYAHYGDMTDSSSILHILEKVKPDEIYNLAAQSHVAVSFELPEYTANCDALGVLRLLEAVRTLKLYNTKIYQAGTSEMFGNSDSEFQNENTPFNPVSPYGVAKLYAHLIVKTYRDAYGLFACNGILFNHESQVRGETFVTRKICKYVAAQNYRRPLLLGNLNAKRDWGHAVDYVKGMYLILQQDKPDDYVLATGMTYSVRKFVELCFEYLYGKNCITWKGEGLNERGILQGNEVVRVDERYFRPNEIYCLKGDATKAREVLGWKNSFTINNIVGDMMDGELYNK